MCSASNENCFPRHMREREREREGKKEREKLARDIKVQSSYTGMLSLLCVESLTGGEKNKIVLSPKKCNQALLSPKV